MSRRHFVETTVREEGQPVPRYRLVCGSCGCGGQLGRMNFGPAVAGKLVPQKFEELGWRVGKRRDGGDDRCPACVNREQEARRVRQGAIQNEEFANVSKPAPPPPALRPVAEPPREMTREHRRLIFLKLEEVYLDERAGYSAGWTDARTATDLGVPRAWVSTIREENFGPSHSEDYQKMVAELADLKALSIGLMSKHDELREGIESVLKKIEGYDRSVKRI